MDDVFRNRCRWVAATSLLLLLVLLSSCREGEEGRGMAGTLVAGIYHWQTTFDLSGEDSAFLSEHQVEKLYLHCFDVDVVTTSSDDSKSVEPIVTTAFSDEGYTASAEVVPVVFVTLEALREMPDVERYAGLIVERTLAMVRYNRLGEIREMQIDCDWTESTEEKFFGLCRAMKATLDRYDIALSATIRLHQLRSTAPPVDRGMLMLYNTGNIRDPKTENSILDYDDVAPYLRKGITYGIPLDLALPVYSWGVWFRDGTFRSILSHPNLDREEIEREESHGPWYRVVREHRQGDKLLQVGDRIRLEAPSAAEVLRVEELALRKIHQEGDFTISLFHLSTDVLNRYDQDELQSLYHH